MAATQEKIPCLKGEDRVAVVNEEGKENSKYKGMFSWSLRAGDKSVCMIYQVIARQTREHHRCRESGRDRNSNVFYEFLMKNMKTGGRIDMNDFGQTRIKPTNLQIIKKP